MVEDLGKPLADITVNDFRNYVLSTVITRYGPKYKLFREAGYDIKPWEIKKSTMGMWDDMETTIAAVTSALSKTCKG